MSFQLMDKHIQQTVGTADYMMRTYTWHRTAGFFLIFQNGHKKERNQMGSNPVVVLVGGSDSTRRQPKSHPIDSLGMGGWRLGFLHVKRQRARGGTGVSQHTILFLCTRCIHTYLVELRERPLLLLLDLLVPLLDRPRLLLVHLPLRRIQCVRLHLQKRLHLKRWICVRWICDKKNEEKSNTVKTDGLKLTGCNG